LLYGMGAKELQSHALKSYGIDMSLEEATLYRRRFFEAYPGLKRWQCGETRTPTGRRRTKVERLTDRLNTPVQGTGADGLKLALALLWERRDECPGAVPVLVCHDEIVVECNAERTEDVRTWLESAMVKGMDEVVNGLKADGPPVPIEVEVESGRTWKG
jgi:DNA polymerase I